LSTVIAIARIAGTSDRGSDVLRVVDVASGEGATRYGEGGCALDEVVGVGVNVPGATSRPRVRSAADRCVGGRVAERGASTPTTAYTPTAMAATLAATVNARRVGKRSRTAHALLTAGPPQ